MYEEKKYWYALQRDTDDAWDNGTFDFDEAVKEYMADDSYICIAVIDANYDADGNATTEAVCIEEINPVYA